MEGDDLPGLQQMINQCFQTDGKQSWYLNLSLLKFEDMNMDIWYYITGFYPHFVGAMVVFRSVPDGLGCLDYSTRKQCANSDAASFQEIVFLTIFQTSIINQSSITFKCSLVHPHYPSLRPLACQPWGPNRWRWTQVLSSKDLNKSVSRDTRITYQSLCAKISFQRVLEKRNIWKDLLQLLLKQVSLQTLNQIW